MSPPGYKTQCMQNGTALKCVQRQCKRIQNDCEIRTWKLYSSIKSLIFSLIMNLSLGRCWMDALELALKCSSLLKRTMIREGKEHDLNSSADSTHVSLYGLLRANNLHSGENLP